MPASHSPFASEASDRIDTVGEVGLLRLIRQWLGEATLPSPFGIGDDCAVAEIPATGNKNGDSRRGNTSGGNTEGDDNSNGGGSGSSKGNGGGADSATNGGNGEKWLFTTDAVVHNRHFDDTCPPELAAAKLLKRNLSDIAAMGGTPHSALLALTLAPQQSLRWLERFFGGLKAASLRYRTPVTGGDITAGTDNFFAAHLTLIGHAARPLLRTGAKAGDHIFVTGALGGSIHGHHLHFEPRLAEGRWLASRPEVRSMIDLTDGLAKDLPELLPTAAQTQTAAQATAQTQTKVQTPAAASVSVALLDLPNLPLTLAAQQAERAASAEANTAASVAASASAATSAIARALGDGEDYELLFTVDGQTDPAEFIRNWQTFFAVQAPPPPGSPTRPQPAYPYHIGRIAQVTACTPQANQPQDHPSATCRLYDAATNQPLPAAQKGFEHLHHPQP